MLRFAGTFALKGKKAKKRSPPAQSTGSPLYENMALTFPAAFRVVVNSNIATGRCWCKCPGFVIIVLQSSGRASRTSFKKSRSIPFAFIVLLPSFLCWFLWWFWCQEHKVFSLCFLFLLYTKNTQNTRKIPCIISAFYIFGVNGVFGVQCIGTIKP